MGEFLNAMREHATRDELCEALAETISSRDAMRTEIIRLTAERDDARRQLEQQRSATTEAHGPCTKEDEKSNLLERLEAIEPEIGLGTEAWLGLMAFLGICLGLFW